MSNDNLGDRMKEYEGFETGRRFLPMLPVYARIDGRSFSNFTRGMDRPFDAKMSGIMEEVTKYLVKETGASTGYTQSDEISLCWPMDDYYSEMMFGGKIQKLTSTLAALATAKFVELALTEFPERCAKRLPTFDARVFQLPNNTELANAFLWRVQDAVKNSIQMTAQNHFSHTSLQGKDQKSQLEMLESEGVIWGNYPRFFKEGTFVKREIYDKNKGSDLPPAIRNRIVALDQAVPFSDHPDRSGFVSMKTIGSI